MLLLIGSWFTRVKLRLGRRRKTKTTTRKQEKQNHNIAGCIADCSQSYWSCYWRYGSADQRSRECSATRTAWCQDAANGIAGVHWRHSQSGWYTGRPNYIFPMNSSSSVKLNSRFKKANSFRGTQWVEVVKFLFFFIIIFNFLYFAWPF